MSEQDVLKEFVDKNLDLIPSENLPQGDLLRFEQVYKRESRKIKFQRSFPHRRISLLRGILVPIAASLLVFLMTCFVKRVVVVNSSSEVTALEVYAEHYQRVEVLMMDIYSLTASCDSKTAQMYNSVVEQVVYEPVSMVDLIPEYLAESEKVAIINEYSAAVCSSLQSIIKVLTD